MKYFFLLVLFLFSFSLMKENQDFIKIENNKLDFVNENLKNIIQKLKHHQKVEIFHIGDSHVQIGEFSKGILKKLKQDSIKTQKGWFLPDLIFNDLSLNNELIKIKGDFKAENIRDNPHLRAGITGRKFTFNQNEIKLKFKFDKPISSFQILHEEFDSYEISTSKKAKINNEIHKTSEINTIEFKKSTKKFKLKLKKHNEESFDFFALRGNEAGVNKNCSYSNFGVSGAKFSDFYYAMRIYDQIQLLKPDIIFVTLGTNDAYYKDLQKHSFSRNLVHFIRKIKEISPKTELIFMSAPDSYYKNEKAPYLKFVNEEIEKVCFQENSAFWNWNKIMGGENSVHNWEKQNMFDTDLLHFSSKGYQFFGSLFVEALLK
jgi:lysophospholipase L1-like esterase